MFFWSQLTSFLLLSFGRNWLLFLLTFFWLTQKPDNMKDISGLFDCASTVVHCTHTHSDRVDSLLVDKWSQGKNWLFKFANIQCRAENEIRTSTHQLKTFLLFLYSVVPMGFFPMGNSGCFPQGNSGCFPQGKPGATVELPNLNQITSPVYAVLLCDHTTSCEAYSFTTDGYGIFNVRTILGAYHTHK